MKILLRIAQAVIIIAPLAFVAWLVSLNFVPSGVLERSFNFSAPSPYADFLVPAQRVTGVQSQAGEQFQEIIQDPVYFHVHLPSSFNELAVGIKFKPQGQPLLEFGPLMTEEAWQYDLRPLWNETIENLDWPYVESAGVRLYQRDQKYSDVQSFLDNLPAMNEIGVYGYTLKTDFRIPGYQPQTNAHEYEIYLRGYHQFLTYLGDGENLDFDFYVQDMNRGQGADPVVINLYREDVLVDTMIIPDGELWREEFQGSAVRDVRFYREHLTPGVYKIEFKAPTDIFIRKIKTTQQKLVIINTAFLGDEIGYRDWEKTQELWTNSNYITAETLHADGTQNLEVGADILRIAESHREYYKDMEIGSDLKRVFSPQGDIKIVGNGLFAPTREAYFNPNPVKIDADTDFDRQGINHVLTGYVPAKKIGDWYYREHIFDLTYVPKDYGTIKYTISAPGVARRQVTPAIAQIDLKFMRDKMTLDNWYEIVKLYVGKALARLM